MRFRWLVNALLTAILLLALAPAPPPAETAEPARERVLVDAGDVDAQRDLARRGGAPLVDYGSFAMWTVPAGLGSAEARALASPAPDEFRRIRLRAGDVLTDPSDSSKGMAAGKGWRPEAGLALLQFIGPVKDEWREAVERTSARFVSYVPNNAYVLYLDDAAAVALAALAAKYPPVQWIGPYRPEYRLAAPLGEKAPGWADVTVQVWDSLRDSSSRPAQAGQNQPDTIARLLALGGAVHARPWRAAGFVNVSLQLPAGRLEEIAAWPDVYNVEPWVPRRRTDERQDMVLAGLVMPEDDHSEPEEPRYLEWLTRRGWPRDPERYPILDIIDDGIDIGRIGDVRHPDFHLNGDLKAASRVAFMDNCTGDPLPDGVAGHGNLNAGIAAGYNDLGYPPWVDWRGDHLGLGVSPFGRLAATKVFANSGPWDTSRCDWSDVALVERAYLKGARLTSNSWGASVFGRYDSTAQTWDALTRDAAPSLPGNQQMLHLFSAGNDGPGPGSLGTPAVAKNVFTVGATEGWRLDGTPDGCFVSDAGDVDKIVSFSSRGPTDDGRRKPDMVAPGTHIVGPATQGNFDGTGVCAMPDDKYIPAGQTWYTWSSGTSHAVPAVAGAAQLAWYWYARRLTNHVTPSPAMLRALLVDSARVWMLGTTPPDNSYGWGHVDLSRLSNLKPRQLVDQTVVLGATGETYRLSGRVYPHTLPLRVTLTWTDAPGNPTGSVQVNDLDLEVVVGDRTYRGNFMEGGVSVPGGEWDPLNNTESVNIETWPWEGHPNISVRVIARNIAGDGVPGNDDPTDQDFALVISGVDRLWSLEAGDVDWREANEPADDIILPGEIVSVTTSLRNLGDAPATGLSGRLAPAWLQGGGVHTPSVSFPDIPSQETRPASGAYRVHVSPVMACGTDLTMVESVLGDGGEVFRHGFRLPIGNQPVEHFQYVGPPVPIPDDDPAGAYATIPITSTSVARGVVLTVNVSHTYDGDLSLYLISPGGTMVTLAEWIGGDGNGYIDTEFDDAAYRRIEDGEPPFEGRYRPTQPLSPLAGESLLGDWRLWVVDSANFDVGAIEAVSLDITVEGIECQAVGTTVVLPSVKKRSAP